jgi:putative membrane-bound dehydrogenase-like protein
MFRPLLIITLLALWLDCSRTLRALDFPSTPPVEPQNAAKTFHVLDGFEMQLIAAEPLVTDPVAITYDADGRAYVCEMNDYPYTDKAAHKPSQENPTDAHIGKVRLLTDTDGDGVFDKATVFAEGLSWPTGAACWKGGIFVTATPDVWYLKDTNDDGVADVRQKVFTGFKKLNVQAVMNNPMWGLDHRIYIAGGSNGGEIQRVPGSESVMPVPSDFKPLLIKRNDFSFDPSTGDVRLESGGARFGQTFDDWGNRFLCNIRNPCQHVVLPYRYLARNPYLVVPSALNDCAEAGDQLPVYRTSPAEPWREFRAKRWVQEGSHLPKSELVGAGVVTSSSGITVYRGDAYPKEYRDFAFVADVAGNLFYRMKLVPDGVTFKAVQVDGTKNFCTSDDLWFRPVNFVNAPDGCLHVCDMYREVIEHPWSIPDDIHSVVDLLRGRDRGRIWRLTPRRSVVPPLGGSEKAPAKAGTTIRSTPKLSAASTTDLVALLDHPNAWHRETAQRLLFERQDKAAVKPLRELVKSGKTAQGRAAAMWALASLEVLRTTMIPTLAGAIKQETVMLKAGDGTSILKAAEDSDANVREHALMILGAGLANPWDGGRKVDSNGFGDGSGTPGPWLDAWYAIQKRCEDPSIRVRVCAVEASSVYSFGFGGSPIQHMLGMVLPKDGNDAWARRRVLSASPSSQITSMMLRRLVSRRRDNVTRIELDLIRETAAIAVASKRTHDLVDALVELGEPSATNSDQLIELAAIIGNAMLRTGWTWRDAPFKKDETTFFDVSLLNFMKKLDLELLRRLEESNTSAEQRIQCLTALASMRGLEDLKPSLTSALQPTRPAELQLAALEALGSYREPAVADMLIDAWPKMTPALRDKATTILLSRTDRIAKLLDAIEAKKITPAQLSVAAKATLGRQKTPALAERIAKLIGDGSSSNRKGVIEKYLTAMLGSDAGTPARNESVVAGKSARITGDATRGSKIYETTCMVCHKFADKGNDVGPHLGTIKAWTAEQLVTNILDPNREVSPYFSLYLVETNDGRTLSGLIASETAGNLTLKRADGGTDTVLRSEIKSLTSPGISLMPEGLEAVITPQQMADLIAYLKIP